MTLFHTKNYAYYYLVCIIIAYLILYW